MKNKYSRRYFCPTCKFKGRASRERADTGIIRCPICNTRFEADLLYRNSDKCLSQSEEYRLSMIKYNQKIIDRLTEVNENLKRAVNNENL